jgi:hypothetical protein
LADDIVNSRLKKIVALSSAPIQGDKSSANLQWKSASSTCSWRKSSANGAPTFYIMKLSETRLLWQEKTRLTRKSASSNSSKRRSIEKKSANGDSGQRKLYRGL